MFRERLISGIILLALAIVTVVLGGDVLLAVSVVISLIGLFEFFRVLKMERTPLAYAGYFSVLLIYLMPVALPAKTGFDLFPSCLAFMLVMAIYVFAFPKYRMEEAVAAFFGVFYLGVMFSYVYRVRMMTDGKFLVWLIFIGSWGSDTCAYCAGRLFGKYRMAPVLSPKKTIEGAAGGVLGAMLIGALFTLAFGKHMTGIPDPMISCVAASGAAAVISQIGDLAASAIKRDHNVKDYGRLIPGHGGILDRFDSMIFTAPAIYFVLQFFCG